MEPCTRGPDPPWNSGGRKGPLEPSGWPGPSLSSWWRDHPQDEGPVSGPATPTGWPTGPS